MTNLNENNVMDINNRPQPHSLEIERAILSAVLRNGEITRINDNRVDVDTFYSHIHREIFKAALNVKSNGSHVDLLTVADALKINGTLEDIGGEIFLAEIHNSIATDANINNWIKIHLEYHAKRMLINQCSETLLKCYSDESTAIDSFNEHRSHLSDIEALSCGMVQKPTIDKLKDFTGYLQELQTGLGGHIIEFGISGMNSLIQLQLKQMIVVGGLSNTGKTRFILCDAIGKLKKGIPTAIFSWENPANIIVSGLVSIMSNIPMSMMTQKGRLKENQMIYIKNAMEILNKNSHLIHIFGKGDYIHSVSGISAEVRRIQDNTGGSLKMAYIDYIQNMKSDKKNRVEQIESIITGISDIGAEHNIATMPLSQLNRDKDRDKSKRRPILADMKGSGEIENAADFVVFLHREDRKSIGNVEVDIYSEKARGNGTFDRKLNFNTLTGEFSGLVLESPRYDNQDRPTNNYYEKQGD